VKNKPGVTPCHRWFVTFCFIQNA